MRNMTKNRHLAKAFSDSGWAELARQRQLQYKANWYGRTVKVNIEQIGRDTPELTPVERRASTVSTFSIKQALSKKQETLASNKDARELIPVSMSQGEITINFLDSIFYYFF